MTYSQLTALLLLTILSTTSCISDTDPNSDPVFYDQIEGGSHMYGSLNFCRTIQITDHIGIYDVPEIKSIVEQTDYGRSPYTYVTLSLLEDWHNAPAAPIARVEGGEMIENGERITSSWSVSIRREKNVILLVNADPAQNNGYYYLHPLRVFPIDDNQMARNSTWFGKESIPLSELQDLIQKAQEYSGPLEDCPYLNKRKKDENRPQNYQEPESDEEYIILDTIEAED